MWVILIASNSKQRYSFNENRILVRANHGHSIPVDIELLETEPLEVLYHQWGGYMRIFQGITKQQLRLETKARRMTEDSIKFYPS